MARVYIPLTLAALAAEWPSLSPRPAFLPAKPLRALTGEALEEAEYRACEAAAAFVVDEALAAGSPRAVIASDVPDALCADAADAIPGVVVTPPLVAERTAIASVHIDEPEEFAAAAAASAQEASEALSAADLLWYDSEEIDHLVEATLEE